MDFSLRDAMCCALASEPTRSLAGIDESLSVLTEQTLARVDLPSSLKLASLCLNCSLRVSHIVWKTLLETRPEICRIAYQQVKESHEIYIAILMGAAGNAPD